MRPNIEVLWLGMGGIYILDIYIMRKNTDIPML